MDIENMVTQEPVQDASENEAAQSVEQADVPQEQPEEPAQEPSDEPKQEAKQEPQSVEDRAGYAAARRRAEAEWEGQKRAHQAFLDRANALARARGFENFDALERAVNAEEESRKAAEYKQKYGIDPDAVKPLVDDAVDRHPAVQAARQAEARVRMEAAQKALADALAEIGKLDDRIKTFDDLPKMDNYELFDDLVRNRRYGMVDAYKLANLERLQEKRAAEERQATLNSVNGRKHLQKTAGSAGESAPVVPADVMAMYKQMNPNASDAEIRAHWAKSQKGEI